MSPLDGEVFLRVDDDLGLPGSELQCFDKLLLGQFERAPFEHNHIVPRPDVDKIDRVMEALSKAGLR